MDILNLVKKDLIISRMSIISWAIFSFIFGVSIVLSNNITTLYIIFTAHVTFLCFNAFFGMSVSDIKNKTDTLFFSLPIDRKSIVISKYITYILISLFFCILYFIQTLYFIHSSNWNTPHFPFSYVSLNLILVALGVGILLASIVQFLNYLVAYKYRKMADIVWIIVYAVGVLGGSIVFRFNYEYGSLETLLMNENLTLIALGILVMGLILYLISMKASIFLYKKIEV